MGFMKHTTLAIAVVNDTLGVVLLGRDLRSRRVLASQTIEGDPASWGDRLAAALPAMLDTHRVDETLVVVPARWCLTRELAMVPEDWAEGREGVLGSLEDLLPMTAEEAHVGLLGLFGSDERAHRGVIVAVNRRDPEPILRALEQAVPGAKPRVLSSHMAALGLGLHGAPRARVIESDGASDQALELAFGLPVGFDAEPVGPGDTVRLGVDISAEDLAVAAARAPAVAPGAFAPLEGRVRRAWSSAVIPLAGIAAAALLVMLGPAVWAARLESGTARAEIQRAELHEPFTRAQGLRAQTEQDVALCRDADAATAGWGSVLPVLEETLDALGDDGFLYRLTLDQQGLSLTGETPAPGAVLEKLESASTLRDATTTAPLTNSPVDPGLSVFTIRAEVQPR